jgi:hypothetical protein
LLDSYPAPACGLCREASGIATGEWIQYQVTWIGQKLDKEPREARRHSRWVRTDALLTAPSVEEVV